MTTARFRQEFEMDTDCKSVSTLFKRFEKKYPRAWEVWGPQFEYMVEKNSDHEEEEGWALWLDRDGGHYYMAIVLTDPNQAI